MRLLIDTQVLIWLTNADKRLGKKALRLLSDTSNQVSVSYFSFFEIVIKASIDKLTFDSSILSDLPKMGIELIMPQDNDILHYTIFSPQNRDPFDNMLITVAINQKHAFVTSDAKILAIPKPTCQLINAAE